MKITFMPQNIVIEGNPNKSLLQMAQENQIKIKSICNGKPSCAECRVKITEGSGNVPPPGKEELNLIGTSYFIDNRRLSCQVRCFGSITVDLTEQMNKIDTQKKIKGVKTKDQKDVHAKQDTFILSDDERAQAAQAAAQAPKPEQRQENRPPSQNQNRTQQNNNRPPNQNKPQQQGKPDNRNNQNNNNNRADNRPPKKPDNRPDIRAQNQNNMNNQKPADSNAKPVDHKDSKE
jgi:ferredoxin